MKCIICKEKPANCWVNGKNVCSRCYIICKFVHMPSTIKNRLKEYYKKKGIMNLEEINKFINNDINIKYKEVLKMAEEEQTTETSEEETSEEEEKEEESESEEAEEESEEE
ncbi:MAG: hypothetical protein ACTSXD_05010 [Candidatus Heimdallarchaeaceae archaeon]